MKTLAYLIAAILALHGLVHLMGFVAYWPIATVAELPYKTVLLSSVIIGLDWTQAFRGAVVNAVALLLAILAYLLKGALPQ